MFSLSSRAFASAAATAPRAASRSIAFTRTYASSSLPPKSAPASSPNVSSTPSTEEALAQNSTTSASELEPISAETKAQLNSNASKDGKEDDLMAESRPTVEDVKKEHTPIDTVKAAPNLAKKTGQA
ncbi:hypothetical protein CF326_g3972 [Tilletia indica]|nr:hypothetical protein CF326_g3972 [Tilletia indica]